MTFSCNFTSWPIRVKGKLKGHGNACPDKSKSRNEVCKRLANMILAANDGFGGRQRPHKQNRVQGMSSIEHSRRDRKGILHDLISANDNERSSLGMPSINNFAHLAQHSGWQIRTVAKVKENGDVLARNIQHFVNFDLGFIKIFPCPQIREAIL
jgi:hypothetical protein